MGAAASVAGQTSALSEWSAEEVATVLEQDAGLRPLAEVVREREMSGVATLRLADAEFASLGARLRIDDAKLEELKESVENERALAQLVGVVGAPEADPASEPAGAEQKKRRDSYKKVSGRGGAGGYDTRARPIPREKD